MAIVSITTVSITIVSIALVSTMVITEHVSPGTSTTTTTTTTSHQAHLLLLLLFLTRHVDDPDEAEAVASSLRLGILLLHVAWSGGDN